ncbi:MAG: DNA methyltransferase [Polyangiales bacterium]
MSDVERRFHENWLGMVQPVEGLVVSVPVLVDAQCMQRLDPSIQARLIELCPPRARDEAGAREHTVRSVMALLTELLGYHQGDWLDEATMPEALGLYVPEGRQWIRPTYALKSADGAGDAALPELLLWKLPDGLDFDRPETVTGSWDYPPSAKFDRLLRHTRVPVGLLCNGTAFRLVYAPHGESSGHIEFDLDAMASVGGRPILDAFVMLLSATRTRVVERERSLFAILSESRRRQANVTNALAEQVFDALQILLRGFESAAQRDGSALLDESLAAQDDHVYKGLLTVLLRLVFVLYAEDRGLLPVDEPLYAQHMSALALFERLQRERGEWPDSMSRRFSAWGQLIALFRAIFLGVEHGTLRMPARRGELFDPHRFAFIEGWTAGSAPITEAGERAAVRVPTIDDEVVYRVLEKLLVFEGQRLSYRALDVEQIGSIYEGLMGYHVQRVANDSVCIKPLGVWTSLEELSSQPSAQRAKWIKENLGLATAAADKLSKELDALAKAERDGGGDAGDGRDGDDGTLARARATAMEALEKHSHKRRDDPSLSRARAGQLVLQPGSERRRTSSHYTPRSLSAPIVERTLEPLLRVMGEAPSSAQILALKVCDPAMGSGAFLVEACRYLADQVLAAWTREGEIEAIAREHGDALLHARRLVAQRCLYGVDKNGAAVELAKLSLWLVTLAKDLPFTFVDHALRHGDSLVGLDFDQIRSFHWKPGKQLELFTREVKEALDEAIVIRQRILELAASKRPEDVREKEQLLWDAQDALNRVRLIGDLVVGAFFAAEKDKDREKERVRRLELVRAWLQAGGAPGEELLELQRALRKRVPALHWAVEFPEVFYAERPDPLDGMRVNGAACMDAFVGNPPFMGGGQISGEFGNEYRDWLLELHEGSHGNADLSAHFFRLAFRLCGTNGTFTFIATNTIAQGDTRDTALRWLLSHNAVVNNAIRSVEWPGAAAVVVSIIQIAIGSPSQIGAPALLDGEEVSVINSALTAGLDRANPEKLSANSELYSKGADIYGQGFVVDDATAAALRSASPSEAAIVRPYLGGEETNRRPRQDPERWVISFGQMTIDQAQRYRRALDIVERSVKVERDQMRDTPINRRLKEFWWRFWADRPEFTARLRQLPHCLVCANVAKHLMFSRQPTDIVFSKQLYVFALSDWSGFTTLQSRTHECWARLLSSSMKTDLRYTASDCFETFPFPQPDPRAVIPELEEIGEKLYTARAKYMVDENVGLTITYNRLKDAANTEPRVVELRALHEEMDRAVLRAYGWEDLVARVPPYCVSGEADKRAVEAFESEVIERLFGLNARRAEEERVKGVGKSGKGAKSAKSAKGDGAASKGAKAKRAKSKGAESEGELALGDGEREE